MSPFVDFEPVGRRGACLEGESLLDCARTLGVELVNICGGGGSCGSCLVQVLEGNISTIEEGEKVHISDDALARGYRLACYAYPESECKVRVPAESLLTQQRTQVEGQDVYVEVDPVAKTYSLELTPPSISDLRSDADRIMDHLEEDYDVIGVIFDFAVLGNLSEILRENNWQVDVVIYQKEIIAVFPPGMVLLGVAVDLGTTKIAMYLIDLQTGQTLSSKGLMNPQIAYGEDIMTRMTAVQEDTKAAEKYQRLVIDAFNENIIEMCAASDYHPEQIVNMVVVGNTAMHHIFLGFPVRQLGRAPYVPEVSAPIDVKARELGIFAAVGAYVYILPNVAGYVGADHISMLLASEIKDRSDVVLAIDIGTNTEICLSNKGKMYSLSTASGPAFEGAHIKYGMRAAAGAIERFQIIDGESVFQTIENVPPIGVCGSGILDILAALRQEGIVNARGKLGEHPLVRGKRENREFVVAQKNGTSGEVTFLQRDIEQLQLAKGAIRTGIDVLLSRQGLSASDLDEVIIAGAFGTYLDVNSAIAIGMLPKVSSRIVRQVGNAAGIGAKQALISEKKRIDARNLAERIDYVELAGDPDFMKIFAKATLLGN